MSDFDRQFQRIHGPAQAKTDVGTLRGFLLAGSTVRVHAVREVFRRAPLCGRQDSGHRGRPTAETASRRVNSSCRATAAPFSETCCHALFEVIRVESGLSPGQVTSCSGCTGYYTSAESTALTDLTLEGRTHSPWPGFTGRKCANRSKDAGIGHFAASNPAYG